MRFLTGLTLTTGLLLGMAGRSDAQFSLGIGNPYTGGGLYINSSPYGYGSVGGLYGGNGYYNSGYVGAPATFAYGSGYAGYAPVAPLGYGYGVRPYYGGYGYRNYGYRPFRGGRRFYR